MIWRIHRLVSERGEVVHVPRDLKTIGGPRRHHATGGWDTYVVARLEKLTTRRLIVWRACSRSDAGLGRLPLPYVISESYATETSSPPL